MTRDKDVLYQSDAHPGVGCVQIQKRRVVFVHVLEILLSEPILISEKDEHSVGFPPDERMS